MLKNHFQFWTTVHTEKAVIIEEETKSDLERIQ